MGKPTKKKAPPRRSSKRTASPRKAPSRSSAKRPQARIARSAVGSKRPSAARKAKAAARKPKAAARKAASPARKKAVPARTQRPSGPVKAGKPARLLRIKLTKKDLEFFRKQLLNLRDRLVDGISFLAGDNLGHAQREASGDLSNYGMHMADQGTDNFDREFALSLVSNEQEVLYEIDEALQRIEQGQYGICEMTGAPIEYERLKVLPYARYCIAAQQEMERNRRRFRSFAPHAPMPSGGEM